MTHPRTRVCCSAFDTIVMACIFMSSIYLPMCVCVCVCVDFFHGVYAVTSCQPPLNDMLQSDIDDLNATGDFSSFVTSVRRRFVDTCC